MKNARMGLAPTTSATSATSAAALVRLADVRGVRLAAEGDRLAYEGPAGAMTADLKAALVAHKSEILALLRGETSDRGAEVAEPPPTWTGEALALVEWLSTLDPSTVPSGAELRPGERVADPVLFVAALRRDVAAGPKGPRAGVLIDDVLRLKAIVERGGIT